MLAIDLLKNISQTIEFESKEVDDKLIGAILFLSNQCISAGELHEWEFIVVKDKRKKEELYEASLRQMWIKSAPVVIAVCLDKERVVRKYGKKGLKYGEQDISFVAYSIVLAANSLELGSYLVQAFNEEKVKEILNLPDNLEPRFLICIGYPKVKREKQRYDIDSITWIDEYGKKYDFSFLFKPGAPEKEITLEDVLKGFLEKKESWVDKIKRLFRKKD